MEQQNHVPGTGYTYTPDFLQFQSSGEGQPPQSYTCDSGYGSSSLENFPSSHFEEAFQVEDHGLEIDPSYEAERDLGNPFRPSTVSHTAPPILSRQSTVHSLGLERNPHQRSPRLKIMWAAGQQWPDNGPDAQEDATLSLSHEPLPQTQHSFAESPAENVVPSVPKSNVPPGFDLDILMKSVQRNPGVNLIGHDLKPSPPPMEPVLKATALIRAWIECSPEQRPSDEDVAIFARLSKLAPTEIDKIFLKTWAENAVKDSQAAADHVTNYAKPLVSDLSSSPGRSALYASPVTLLRAGEWVSQQIYVCKPPKEDSATANTRRPRIYPCSFCSWLFPDKDSWRRHEELKCPQEGWLCNLDLMVQIEGNSQCTHCDVKEPDMDHFHIKHPEHAKFGPCCRRPLSSKRIFSRRERFVDHLRRAHTSLPPQIFPEIVIQSRFNVSSVFETNCHICSVYEFRDWQDRINHLAQHAEENARRAPKRDRPDKKDDKGGDESDEDNDGTDPKPPGKRARKSQSDKSERTENKKTSSSGPTRGRDAHDMPPSNTLKDRLINVAVSWPPSSSNYFIPQDVQKKLMTRQAILDELKHAFGGDYSTMGEELNEIVEFTVERAVKVFAILILIGKIKSILNFKTESVSDGDLPFQSSDIKTNGNLLTTHNSARIHRLFGKWSSWDIQEFSRFQWILLAPVFELGRSSKHCDFQRDHILPFLEDDESNRKSGGYGLVWRVKIHPEHLRWSEDPGPENLGYHQFAIKRLHSADKKAFDLERNALIALNLKNNPHIVTLLGSYTSKGYHHLIFPHADDTLQSYWQRVKEPCLDSDQGKATLWMVQQCKAIADGLSAIHNFKTTTNAKRTDPKDNLYGRHGDLKPANILWFRDKDSGDPDTTRGRLVISDFGLARFHKLESRSNVDPASISGSITYMPPECELRSPVSRAYDIWSMGCLILEFITWLHRGWEGVEEFARVRSVNVGDLRDDKFYTVLGYKASNARSAILRPVVSWWIEMLREDPLSTPCTIDFLGLVQESILVPDPKHRMGARDIVGALSKMLERARFDPGYISTPHHCHTTRANNSSDDHQRRPLRTVQIRTRERKYTHQNRSI